MRNSDLHAHSYYSDGEMPPKKIVQLAKKRNLKYLALTDHNSFSGVAEAVREGKRLGVNVIPAIEIATKENEILAYFVETNNKQLNQAISAYRTSTTARLKDICRQLAQMGYKISYSDVERKCPHSKGNYNYLHIGRVLLDRGYIAGLFDVIGLIKEKVKNKKKVDEMSTVQAVKFVRAAGGIPVLSHPWVSEESRALLQRKNLEKLIRAGLCGLEIDNGDTAPFKKPGIAGRIRRLAKRYDLILTSGSDFHGEGLMGMKTHSLGAHNSDEGVIYELLARKAGF